MLPMRSTLGQVICEPGRSAGFLVSRSLESHGHAVSFCLYDTFGIMLWLVTSLAFNSLQNLVILSLDLGLNNCQAKGDEF